MYILRCGDGSLYTGSTNNVARRVAAHRSGKGAKYTRSRLPLTLVYQETCQDWPGALRREAAIKKLTRAEKLALIAEKEKRRMDMKELERPAEFAWALVDQCDYGVLAMAAGDGTPYGIPMAAVRIGHCIYFHTSMTGRKNEIYRENDKVCMTFVGQTELYQKHFTILYSSAIAEGRLCAVTDVEEKKDALRALCKRFAPDMENAEATVVGGVARTAVWKLEVEKITGKTNRDFYKED